MTSKSSAQNRQLRLLSWDICAQDFLRPEKNPMISAEFEPSNLGICTEILEFTLSLKKTPENLS